MAHYRNHILKGEKEGGINLNAEKLGKVRKRKGNMREMEGRGRERKRKGERGKRGGRGEIGRGR